MVSSLLREETIVLRTTRGTVAGIFLVAFGLVTYYALVVEPFRNHGSIPLKVLHTSTRTLESRGLAYFSTWRIVMVSLRCWPFVGISSSCTPEKRCACC